MISSIEISVALFCVSILFFFKSIYYKFASDDLPVYLAGKNKKRDFKMHVDQIIGKERISEKLDHSTTIILHAIVCVLIYIAFGCNKASLIASLLFMFNPSNNQGSVWISGRSYVWPSIMLLLALSLPYASTLFFYASAYFNVGFFAPLAFLLHPENWKSYAFLIVPALALRFAYFKKNVKSKMDNEMFDEDKKITPKKLILYFKTFGYYFTLCLIPFRHTFYHSFMQSSAGNRIMKARAYKMDKFFFVGVIAFSAMSFYIITNHNMTSFALSWFVISISPFCNLFRVSQEIAERYMYLPMIGLMYALGSILCVWWPITMPIVAMYATKLWFYMDAYQDDYYLTEVACINSRDAWFAWHVRAMKRFECRSIQEAVTLWVMARMISPLEFKVLFNLSVCLRIMNKIEESEQFLKDALANIPAGQEEQVNGLVAEYRAGKLAVLM